MLNIEEKTGRPQRRCEDVVKQQNYLVRFTKRSWLGLKSNHITDSVETKKQTSPTGAIVESQKKTSVLKSFFIQNEHIIENTQENLGSHTLRGLK